MYEGFVMTSSRPPGFVSLHRDCLRGIVRSTKKKTAALSLMGASTQTGGDPPRAPTDSVPRQEQMTTHHNK